jgi:hypothetical protein
MDANVPRAANANARQPTRKIAASEDGNFVKALEALSGMLRDTL